MTLCHYNIIFNLKYMCLEVSYDRFSLDPKRPLAWAPGRLPRGGAWAAAPWRLGMQTVENGWKNPKPFPQPHFWIGNGNENRNAGREKEIGITGYRERNSSIGNMSITIGNQKLKTGKYM